MYRVKFLFISIIISTTEKIQKVYRRHSILIVFKVFNTNIYLFSNSKISFQAGQTKNNMVSSSIHTFTKTVRNENKCEICQKVYSNKYILKDHFIAIHEQKKYKCDSCGKSFTTSSTLKRHIKTIHDGHTNHKCESCGKLFSHTHHLKNHIHTVHEGRKDYKCESCGKSFSHGGNLKKHSCSL